MTARRRNISACPKPGRSRRCHRICASIKLSSAKAHFTQPNHRAFRAETRSQDPDLRRIRCDRHGSASTSQISRRRGYRGRGGRHLGLARSLGADLAVDYTTDAFDQLGRSFDFVLDAVGKLGIRRWRRLLKPRGVFATTDLGPWSQNLLFLLWSRVTGNGRVVIPLAKRGSGQAFVTRLRDKIEAGQLIPVVDRKYPLAAIADAYRYVQTGEKAGVHCRH